MSANGQFKHWWTGNGASVFFMRYVPVINTIALVLHIGFLLAGRTWHYAELFAGTSLSCTLLLLALSMRFGFCRLHKLLINYDFLVEICIILQQMNVFKGTLLFFRWTMFIIGIILLSILIYKFKKYNSYNFFYDD